MIQKLIKLLPAAIAVVYFVPGLLVTAQALNQPLTSRDIILAFPIVIYFGLLGIMYKLSEDSTTYYTAEEKKGFRLLLIISAAALVPLWIAMVTVATQLPHALALSSTLALAFVFYDLFRLTARLQKPAELRHIVGFGLILPLFIAFGSCYAGAILVGTATIINPYALFFVLRALLSMWDDIRVPA